jgi:class 3 adenylate cyclase
MQEESRRLAEKLREEKGLPALQIRVGLNTGSEAVEQRSSEPLFHESPGDS